MYTVLKATCMISARVERYAVWSLANFADVRPTIATENFNAKILGPVGDCVGGCRGVGVNVGAAVGAIVGVALGLVVGITVGLAVGI